MSALRRAKTKDRSDRAVAIIGASADRSKYGNKAVRAYLSEGYTVWPVNPREESIEGIRVYHRLDELPGLPHRASIYLREDAALATLRELARMEAAAGKRIGIVYINPGADTDAVVALAEELGLKHAETCSIRAIGRTPDEFGE